MSAVLRAPRRRRTALEKRLERQVILLGAVLLGLLFALTGCGTSPGTEPISGVFHSGAERAVRGERVLSPYCQRSPTGGEASVAYLKAKPHPEADRKPEQGFSRKSEAERRS